MLCSHVAYVGQPLVSSIECVGHKVLIGLVLSIWRVAVPVDGCLVPRVMPCGGLGNSVLNVLFKLWVFTIFD